MDLWSSWDRALYKPGLVDDMVQSFALLAPIDAWFTEGCDTAALQKAKALLETLAG